MTVITINFKLFVLFVSANILLLYPHSVITQLRNKRFQTGRSSEQKQIIFPLMGKKIQRLNSVEICYAGVGCFEIPRHHNPLQKVPENPESLQTQFYLYRRDINITSPQILNYNDDLKVLRNSKLNPKQSLKIIIHGYSTRWNEVGALAGVRAYLDIEDCNVILVNWEKGARGPGYSTAAANTELVGRQLRLLLEQILVLGQKPEKIHLIGFSLGAHVAACASQELKDKEILLGRITGLDPASPLFKLNHFRDNRKKLDVSDASFVDVIHTDGSPIITDGFGLLEPLGHVDYFPNGGRQQPGCNDIKNSVVVSHFDKNLDRAVACSHIRAYHYFLETLEMKASAIRNKSRINQCTFVAFSCPKGPRDFLSGRCFPVNTFPLGTLGEDSTGQGAMYLVTTGAPPFCGTQIQMTIAITPQTKRTRGVILATLVYGNYTSEFQTFFDLTDKYRYTNSQTREINAIFAVEYNSINAETSEIYINLYYNKPQEKNSRYSLYLNHVHIKDMNGLSWQHCGDVTLPQHTMVSMKLILGEC